MRQADWRRRLRAAWASLRIALCGIALFLPAARAADTGPSPGVASGEPMPFGQVVNLAAVREASSAPPATLVATIRRWGLEVLRVRSQPPTAAPNPLLAALPEADPELLGRAEFQTNYEGRLVCSDERAPQRLDLILIRDSAPAYTLLHEFVHAVVKPVCPSPATDPVIEARFRAAFHRLTIYQRRIYGDPWRLLDARWRRDLLAAQADVAADLYDRIRFGQSQEAIAEKLLARHIGEDSPYFDAARREQGRRYAEAMIDNAIDLFNAVEASRTFLAETVRGLQAAIRSGELRPGDGESLSDGDVAAALTACDELAARLAPTRAALEDLKAFQRR